MKSEWRGCLVCLCAACCLRLQGPALLHAPSAFAPCVARGHGAAQNKDSGRGRGPQAQKKGGKGRGGKRRLGRTMIAMRPLDSAARALQEQTRDERLGPVQWSGVRHTRLSRSLSSSLQSIAAEPNDVLGRRDRAQHCITRIGAGLSARAVCVCVPFLIQQRHAVYASRRKVCMYYIYIDVRRPGTSIPTGYT